MTAFFSKGMVRSLLPLPSTFRVLLARSTSAKVRLTSSETRFPVRKKSWRIAKSLGLLPAADNNRAYSSGRRYACCLRSFLGMATLTAGEEGIRSCSYRYLKYSRSDASLRALVIPDLPRSDRYERYSIISALVTVPTWVARTDVSWSQIINCR